MKRGIAICFLLLFLTANTAFGQLLGLPALVRHYLEHAEADNTSWYEFLSEHYADTINHPDDQHRDHEQLPFKALGAHVAQVVSLAPQAFLSISQIIPETATSKRANRNQQDCSNAYLDNIWQPPRLG